MTTKERYSDFIIDDHFDYIEVDAWDEVEEVSVKMRLEFWEIINWLVDVYFEGDRHKGITYFGQLDQLQEFEYAKLCFIDKMGG